MRRMKKIATLILAICLIVPCFSLLTHAADDGRIMFTDHMTTAIKTGTTVQVKGVVKKAKGDIGKIDITMTYDTECLDFQSGEGITETSPGTLRYQGECTNASDSRKEFYMTFEALKAGTTVVKIKESTVKSLAGDVLTYKEGTSTIKIEGETIVKEETPSVSSEVAIEIGDKTYQFASKVPADKIPEGYVVAELEYDMENYSVVYNENLNLYLAYLLDEEKAGSLFMYVDETATFVPYETVKISDTTTIILLSDSSEVVLPEEYEEIELLGLTGHVFPAWQKGDAEGFCVIYAMNLSGEKQLYQMDTVEGTYQRFEAPEVVEKKEVNGILGKLTSALEDHLDYFVLGAGFGFLLFVIIIIVLSVKLYNRNAELDEIYEEYGLDDETEAEDDIILDIDDLIYGDEDDEDEDDDVSELYDTVDDEEEDTDVDMETTEEPEAEDFIEEDEEEKADDEEIFLQEGMKEVFPEEPFEDSMDQAVGSLSENIVEEETEEEEEDTLGSVLAQQKEAKKETEQEDDDDILENFSVDFIDLDD